ncbi:MAG: M23 family metallopeptidase, partial [Kiritimatiellia bacterium]|nr:M23 family metallopeptidase [Kiritimatiellia bacterium]
MPYLGPVLYSPPPKFRGRSVARRGRGLFLMTVAGILLTVAAGRLLLRAKGRKTPPATAQTPASPKPDSIRKAPLRYAPPTGQIDLTDTTSTAVFMPTASGRIESALYGSTRTRMTGGRARAAFHEGVDIAPLQRDRRGKPLDPVLAVTTGTVAYISRHAGNSTYGIYVVLRHKDPVGDVYTLYAHLASVSPNLAVGQPIAAGDPVGLLGNTGDAIPMSRAHLHFEIGTIANNRFPEWYRRQRLKPDHGIGHGWNLWGIDPLAVFSGPDPSPLFSMEDYLLKTPAAFDLVIKGTGPIDYFRRYPSLWKGDRPPEDSPGVVLSVS